MDRPIILPVNAAPLLAEVARKLDDVKLDAVLIGNAAAALQGAPVTTIAFDFFFRNTPGNLKKLKAFARGLGATILRPYYPVSNLYRIVRDEDGLQVDFMVTIHGIRSDEGIRARASTVASPAPRCEWQAWLMSSRASARPAARAIWLCSRFWKPPVKKPISRRVRLAAVARESRRNLIEMIRRWQALPPHKRTHFWRPRVRPGGSAL